MCASPREFQTFHRPWYGLESATDSATRDIIMCVHGKGGLISENFSFLSSKVPNHYPAKEKILKINLLRIGAKVKNLAIFNLMIVSL